MVIGLVYRMIKLKRAYDRPAKTMACAIWWSDSAPGDQEDRAHLGRVAQGGGPELRAAEMVWA